MIKTREFGKHKEVNKDYSIFGVILFLIVKMSAVSKTLLPTADFT